MGLTGTEGEAANMVEVTVTGMIEMGLDMVTVSVAAGMLQMTAGFGKRTSAFDGIGDG